MKSGTPTKPSKSVKSTKSVRVQPVVHEPATNPSSQLPRSPSATPSAISVTSSSASPPPVPLSFAARVTAAVDSLTQAKSLLGLDKALSTTQIMRAVKFKKGGEEHVPTLAGLSVRYGVEVPSRPTADMTALLEMATQLEPARAAIAELSKIVDDAYFGSRSETWATATSLYSMLKKGSTRDPNLASALQPLQDYFAHRHPSVVANHPKRSPAKAADKQQQKVAKRIAKLHAQLAQLQSEAPAPTQTPSAAAATPTAGPTGHA